MGAKSVAFDETIMATTASPQEVENSTLAETYTGHPLYYESGMVAINLHFAEIV
jgi:hypothetical protein